MPQMVVAKLHLCAPSTAYTAAELAFARGLFRLLFERGNRGDLYLAPPARPA